MADLIAIGYPEETTADAAVGEARRQIADLIIQPDAIAVILRDTDGSYHARTTHHAVGGNKYGGTVLKTSLSKDDEKELQDALHGSVTAA